MAKVLYDFAGQRENELTITAGQLVEIVQKETNGKPPTLLSCIQGY
jgi:myosin-1